MKRITQKIMLGILLVFLTACNIEDELESIVEFKNGEKVWIFAQFNIEQESNKTEDYFYFGEINKSLYEKIKASKVKSGFMSLDNVRYWDTDDTIQSISDEIYLDEMIFRIEDIRKIDLVRKNPKIGFKYSDYDEQLEAPIEENKAT